MLKRTLYFGHPTYLSLDNGQLVIKFPEIEGDANSSEEFKGLPKFGVIK